MHDTLLSFFQLSFGELTERIISMSKEIGRHYHDPQLEAAKFLCKGSNRVLPRFEVVEVNDSDDYRDDVDDFVDNVTPALFELVVESFYHWFTDRSVSKVISL